MKCPACGSELISLDNRPPRGCPCGWRRGQLAPARRDFVEAGPVGFALLGLSWIIVAAMVGGSYWWLNHTHDDTQWRIPFFVGWPVYVLLCWFFRPPSTEDVTFVDFVWFRNPHPFESVFNQIRFYVALFMIPGKYVCYALYSTMSLLRRRA